MDHDWLDIGHITYLTNELTAADVSKLRFLLKVPPGVCGDCDGVSLLYALRGWDEFNPFLFYQALTSMERPDLVAIACYLPWLCVSEPMLQTETIVEELSIKTLLRLLRTELSNKHWKIIAISLMSSLQGRDDIMNSLQGRDDIESIISVCLDKGLITTSLFRLKKMLTLMERFDVAERLNDYRGTFVHMDEDEFVSKMKRELSTFTQEIRLWESKLKKFLSLKNSKVTQMLGDDQEVSLESVYVNLTIIKQKPRPVNYEDETTFNEIAFLRKLANKEIQITPVDFPHELRYCTEEKPEIWYLIGNPGCGKTFLAKRTILRFGQHEIKKISFSIAIACRSTNWHTLESTRIEEDRKITPEFVQDWLCIGLPTTAEWSKDLAKHLAASGGEGLLLVIDGLDEFTKKVPFDKTLLYSLLILQTLPNSNVILTTRPAAWTDISSKYELKIDRFYQVLGFSPENRDLYFKKQICNETKLQRCMSLLERYEEMSQLSLIPVNASLFAALMKDESVSINTLTQLYSALTSYLIKRQVCKMGLEEFVEGTDLNSYHSCVRDCVNTIGLIAFGGVARRELTATEKVPIIIDHVEKESHCLGLAHEYHHRDSPGIITEVWAFVHLTMQEFIGAIWLSWNRWTNQCLSIRYISNSDDNFSLFRMIVRFLCGLLSEKSAAVLTILYKLLTPRTVPSLPMYFQLGYDIDIKDETFLQYAGWYDFTEKYFQFTPILFETNSNSILKCFKKFLPHSILIFLNVQVLQVSPNEWICFLHSLQYFNHIKMLHIHTDYIDLSQFEVLLSEVRGCFVSCLALRFYNKSFFEVLAYTELIEDTEFIYDTKISIDLNNCAFKNQEAVNFFSPNNHRNLSCLRLYGYKYSNKLMEQIIIHHVSAIHHLDLNKGYSGCFIDTSVYTILLPALSKATQLRGLYFHNLPRIFHQQLSQLLPQLSNLQEIKINDYSLLPQIRHLSCLALLEISDLLPKVKVLSDDLLQLMERNNNTMRGLMLWRLDRIGFSSWDGFLKVLDTCTNLVKLELRDISLSTDTENLALWRNTTSTLIALVHLKLIRVTLFDAGFIPLCHGLVYHSALKCLHVGSCKQSSQSCEVLINLIPTVFQLETLIVNNLSNPNPGPIGFLKRTVDEYSITASF